MSGGRWSLVGFFYLVIVTLTASIAVAQDPQKKPINKSYDDLWYLTYETLYSENITLIATIKEGQITGRMMNLSGTSDNFEVKGEVDMDGTYAVDLDGGGYMGESNGALGTIAGHGEYTPPPKSSFEGCYGTWTWRRKK